MKKKPWLTMISGDHHFMAFDSGEFNLYGGFPIFHCGPIDSRPSCKPYESNIWTSEVFMKRGQYCIFDIYTEKIEGKEKKCLKMKGYQMDTLMTEFDLCE